MESIDKIKSLYQNKEYEKVLESLSNIDNSNDNAFNYKVYYNWSYYKLHFSNPGAFSEENINKSKAFVKKIMQDYTNKDLIYQLVVLRYVDQAIDKPSPNYTKISEFLENLDPDLLGSDSFEFKDNNGKTRHTASNKEKWYSLKTKCLEEIEDYHNCLRYCEMALTKVTEFHFDNDIWFKRRQAISMFELNQRNEAIKLIDEILMRKKEWFIFSDKGFMLIRMNQKEKGIQYLVQALNMPGPDQMKLKIYQYFVDNYKDEKYSEFSKIIRTYIIRIREKNDWPVSEDAKKFKESLDSETLKIPFHNFKKKIMLFIEKEFETTEISTTGKIGRMNGNGKTGIIKPDIGPSLFFRSKNVLNNTRGFSEGTKVTFEITDSFDKINDTMSKEAINIRII